MKILIIVLVILIILIIIIKNNIPLKKYKINSDLDTDINNYTPPRVFDNFITPNEAKELINFSKNFEFINGKISIIDVDKNIRNNNVTWLEKTSHRVIRKICSKLEKITKYNRNNFENFQIAMYKNNQFYDYHYDESIYDNYNLNDDSPRVLTALIYLNQDFQGGNTEFKNLNLRIKPKTGRLLLFDNLNKAKKNIHYLSEHRGQPVKNGFKWIINIWIHNRVSIQGLPFNFLNYATKDREKYINTDKLYPLENLKKLI